VSTRDVFSEHELAGLREFPEISQEELIRFFTLTGADEAFLRSTRQPTTALGVAVQLCSLPWLGFVPDEVAAVPRVAVERVAGRLGIASGELAGYGQREQTRTDHLRTVMSYLGWRSADELSLKELDEFLLARAMEHDSPSLLFRLACEHLITARVVRPGPVKLLERVAAARVRPEQETHDRIAYLLTATRRVELDGLLVVDSEIGMTRLRWLGTGPTEASAAAVKTEVRKLEFLRGLHAHTLDLSNLPAERRRHLAAVGRRSSMSALSRRDPHRRYPIVLTLLAQSAVDVLDEVVQLFDQAVSARESRARHKLADQLAERAKRGEDKLALAEEILPCWPTRRSPMSGSAGCCASGSDGPAARRPGGTRHHSAATRSRPPRHDRSLLRVPAPVHPRRAEGALVRRRTRRGIVVGGGGRTGRAQCQRGTHRPGRRPDRVRAHPLARLPR
jgi:hypothetical protein